jgi:hypothetical protein
MPKEWFLGAPEHNHNALVEAIGQGLMFMLMREGNINAAR